MKKNINILIESIIKNVISDINKNYIIIEENWFTDFGDSVIDFGDSVIDTGVDFVSANTPNEDFSEAVLFLIGASGVTTLENMIPPTSPKIKSVASGVAGALYLIAGDYFSKLSNQQSEGTQLKSYFKVQGYIYKFIGCFTMGFFAAALTSGLNDIINVTTAAHKLGKTISEIDSLVSPSEILSLAKKSIDSQPILSRMGFSIRKVSNQDKHVFFIGDVIMFKEIEGKHYIVLPDTPVSRKIKADVQALDKEIVPQEDLIVIDIDTLKNQSIVSDGELSGGLIEVPIDKITFKDMDAGTVSDMYSQMRSASIKFSTSISTKRVGAAKTGYIASLREASMQLGKIQKSMTSGKSLSSQELRAIVEELDTLVKGDKRFAGIKLNQDEITTFLEASSEPATRESINRSISTLKGKIDDLRDTKRNVDTSNATGAPQKQSDGSQVEGSRIGLNRLSDNRSLLDNKTSARVNSKRNLNIVDLTNDLKTGQAKLASSLSANPIKINHPLIGKAGTALYEGELVIFAYRSPGVFIGAMSFKKEIQNLESIMAINLKKSIDIKRAMENTGYSKYLDIDPVTLKAKLKKPSGEGAKDTMPKAGDKLGGDTYDDFMLNYKKYNEIMDNHSELAGEIKKLKSIGTNEKEAGTIPMAFDMEGHTDLYNRVRKELGEEEFNSLLALRRDLKISSDKDSAWLKIWSKKTALLVYNNTSMLGVVLTGANMGVHTADGGLHMWLGEDVSISRQELDANGEIIEVLPAETAGVKIIRELDLEDYYSED